MKSPKILVVDDEGALREVLKKILEREGFVVNAAKDGEDALRKLKADTYQLLITDLRMPVKGGLEILDEVAKVHPAIKIIIVTGYPLDPAIQKQVESGSYAYFAKPFENAKLVEKVHELTQPHLI